MRKSRFTEVRIVREADKSTSVEEVINKHGISRQTFYAWKQKSTKRAG